MNNTLIREFVKKIKSENMSKLDKLKKELKEWEDMVPVNNMGKWSRQTRIDSIKNQIDEGEDIGPDYDSAGFTEDDRIINGQYKNNK